MLHIVNGRSTQFTLEQSGVPGRFFSFCDALIDGPAPAVNGAEWKRIRAQHLAASYVVDQTSATLDLEQQDTVLAASVHEDEVVLWFEHDLFCLLNLIFLLDSFRQLPVHLSLINIGSFPGRPNLRGLGELNVAELSSLFPERKFVTERELELAAKAWQAYRANDPREVEKVRATDTPSIPFLKEAFLAHLQRFPATVNGLNRLQRRCLQILYEGPQTFFDIFPRFTAHEAVYGLGDAQLWSILVELANGPAPMITTRSNDPVLTSGKIVNTTFELTEDGRRVLAQESDFIELNGIDKWLGGVHLESGKNLWRWDDETSVLVNKV